MKQKCDILPFLVHPALIPTKVAFSEIAGFFLCNSLLYSPKGKYYQHISRWKGLQQSKLAEASGSFEIHRSWLVWLMADWKALQGTKSESQVKRWLNRPSSDWPWHNTSRAENNGGQQTMSGLIADLTGQTLILPVILTGHFWIQTYFFVASLHKKLLRKRTPQYINFLS